MAPRYVPQPIAKFQPRWMHGDTPLRYGLGCSIDCPHHGPPCRLEFWFVVPCDGGGPVAGKKLWDRVGSALIELTVYPMGGVHQPIDVPGHWRGYIVHGEVQTAYQPDPDDDIVTEPGIPPMETT